MGRKEANKQLDRLSLSARRPERVRLRSEARPTTFGKPGRAVIGLRGGRLLVLQESCRTEKSREFEDFTEFALRIQTRYSIFPE